MKWIDKLKQTVKPGDQTKPELHGRDESVPHAEQPEQPVPRADTPHCVLKLYPREREVFHRLLDGEMMKDIATELNIKTSTVNAYCREIYKKLGVNSKAQLIIQYSNLRESERQGGNEQT